MQTVTIPTAKRLIEARAVPSISIYMNADKRAPGGPSDRIRLHRLLRRAADLLAPAFGRRGVDALLTPIAERAREPWPNARSIGFLRSPEASDSFALPVEVPEMAIVSSTFHTKPLVSALDGGSTFALLAISEDLARLYQGDAVRLTPMGDGIPASSRLTANPHAWRQAVDAYVYGLLRDTEPSLVLAGGRREVEAFRATSRYPWIVEEVLECDLEQVRVVDLHAPAATILQANLADREAQASARYLAAATAGAASDDLAAVAHAAVTGRVLLLVHRRGAHVWGALDRTSGAFVLREGEPGPGDADLIDDLCEIVLQRGGEVVEVAPERMPCERPVCAVVRTALTRPQTGPSSRRPKTSSTRNRSRGGTQHTWA